MSNCWLNNPVSIKSGEDSPRAALQALAATCDGQSTVLGIGLSVTQALGVTVAGLRGFPVLPDARPPIPATQQALLLVMCRVSRFDFLRQQLESCAG